MKNILLIFFLTVAAHCFSQGDSTFLSMKFARAQYAVSYPSNWRIDTATAGQAEFVLYSPKESDTDNFSENVNLMIQDLTGQDLDLDKYGSLSQKQIQTLAKDLEGFEMKKIVTGSIDFYKLQFKSTFGAFRLLTQQYYFVQGEKAFIITSSAEVSKSSLPGEKILASFTLKR